MSRVKRSKRRMILRIGFDRRSWGRDGARGKGASSEKARGREARLALEGAS